MNGHLSISKAISFIMLFIPFVSVTADDEAIEEIIVTASFIDEALSELGTPLHVIDGESVTNGASLSIGAMGLRAGSAMPLRPAARASSRCRRLARSPPLSERWSRHK